MFLAYAGLASSAISQDTLYDIWKNRRSPSSIKLSEEDYSSLACNLALRGYAGNEKILSEQSDRIRNPDRKARFLYLIPALSSSQAVRDSVFYSFRDPKNRARESWVLGALGYLQHPLRVTSSEKYLASSLEWLSDIQKTGDVFFPGSWLQANFGNYQDPVAAALVEQFLRSHPNYNPKLKEKILQAADNLFRAQVLQKRIVIRS